MPPSSAVALRGTPPALSRPVAPPGRAGRQHPRQQRLGDVPDAGTVRRPDEDVGVGAGGGRQYAQTELHRPLPLAVEAPVY